VPWSPQPAQKAAGAMQGNAPTAKQ